MSGGTSETIYKNCLYGESLSDNNLSEGIKCLGEYIINGLEKQKDAILVVNDDTGEKVTGYQFKTRSISVAKSLTNFGIKTGDLVGIVSENCLEHYYITYATIFLNAIIVPVNPIYKESDIENLLKITSPKIIFSSLSAVDKVLNAAKQCSTIEKIVALGNDERCESFETFCSNIESDTNEISLCEPVNLKDTVAAILLSSGTSGVAKAAELTQMNLYSYNGLRYYTKINTFTISVGSFAHASGFALMLTLPVLGEKAVLMSVYDDIRYFKCLEKYKIQVIFLSPGHLKNLLDHPLLHTFDLSHLKIIISGSNIVSENLIEEAKRKLGIEHIIRTYGLTESFGTITQPITKPPIKNSIGCLRPGVWGKVIDPDTHITLGPNQTGEIMIKSNRVFKGYHKDPVATVNAFDKDGFMHTGDLGYYDADGNWFYVERMKDLIIYEDTHIYPSLVEPIILEHPHVIDACIIGIPSEKYGELAAAFVITDGNASVTEQEIVDFVAERVDDSDRLRGGVKFIKRIPKNAMQKPLRRILRQSALRAFK